MISDSVQAFGAENRDPRGLGSMLPNETSILSAGARNCSRDKTEDSGDKQPKGILGKHFWWTKNNNFCPEKRHFSWTKCKNDNFCPEKQGFSWTKCRVRSLRPNAEFGAKRPKGFGESGPQLNFSSLQRSEELIENKGVFYSRKMI